HGADRFLAGTHLDTWLCRLLGKVFAGGRGERDARVSEPAPSPPEEERLLAGAELELLGGVAAGAFQSALMALPERGRMAILLDLEGLSEAELADALGCGVETVAWQLSRARATLRRELRRAA
ncbi:MAG TPA: sigma factor-like helix-turn-helix DNA-binding protein, partial [Candidatus Dormibacteraeota bacterium]|nr:sigma factor-like helix-turn-helix DNA-binding protein [Candidatus Dormibacteraeota bacterium]